jgi:hypothetical protein
VEAVEEMGLQEVAVLMDREEGMLPQEGRMVVQEGQEEMSIIKSMLTCEISNR